MTTTSTKNSKAVDLKLPPRVDPVEDKLLIKSMPQLTPLFIHPLDEYNAEDDPTALINISEDYTGVKGLTEEEYYE